MRSILKIFVLAVMFGALAIGVSAEENLIYPTGMSRIAERIGEVEEAEVYLNSANEKTLEEYLIEKCKNHETLINIYSYKISGDDIEDVYFSFATRHPELMIHTGIRYSVVGNNVYYIMPQYIFETVDEDNAARKLMQKKVSEYAQVAATLKNPIEKILAVHDEMVKNCEYDMKNSDEPISHHAYGIFANNTAVCQGYAQAFYMIMNELGIENNFCISDSVNHEWNYVKVDGKWYHVDVTWDDPVSQSSPTVKAYHKNFMISDETRKAIINSKDADADTSDWQTYLETLPDCSYKNFESEYLFNIHIPFTVSYDGEFFKATCTYSDGYGGTFPITFRSKSLHSGAIATTEFTPYVLTSSTRVSFSYYYYVLSDYSGSITPVSLNVDNGQYKSFVFGNAISLNQYGTYSATVSCDTTSDYTDIFFWNTETLLPGCEKTRIVH